MNPNGENLLKDKDTITVVDQMPKIMTLLSDSITVNGKSLAQSGCTFTTGTGDVNNNEYKFTVPDEDRKSTRLNSSHIEESRMPSSA